MSSALAFMEAADIQGIDDAVVEMEQAGFLLDSEYCLRGAGLARAEERAILDSLASTLAGKLGRPAVEPDDIWTSHPKMIYVLEKVLGLPPSPYKTKGEVDLASGKRSTDKRAMEWILGRTGNDAAARDIISGVMRLRRVRSSCKYLEKLPRFIGPSGFIHPVCGPAGDTDDRVGALTGRFAMKNPEGQQIPRDPKKDPYFIRKAFIAPPGMSLVCSDYTALEVVVLANICNMLFGDRLLLDLTMPGMDIHAYNAHKIFGELLGWSTPTGRLIKDLSDPKGFKTDPELTWYRDLVKSVIYGLFYRKGAYGFGLTLTDQEGALLGEARAQEVVDALFEACPPLKKYHDWIDAGLESSPTIVALDGRLVDYSDVISRGKWGMKAAQRAGSNFPMQASGAGVVGSAMVAAMRSPELKRLGAIMQLQIHDEIMWRIPDENVEAAKPVILDVMNSAYPLENLRATVGSGKSWYDAK